MVDDVVVRGEDPVREPIVAQILPDVLLRVQLRALGGSGTIVMLAGTTSLAEVCQPAWSTSSTAWRPGATLRDNSARNSAIISRLHQGRISPAALPSLGQMAPKM